MYFINTIDQDKIQIKMITNFTRRSLISLRLRLSIPGQWNLVRVRMLDITRIKISTRKSYNRIVRNWDGAVVHTESQHQGLSLHGIMGTKATKMEFVQKLVSVKRSTTPSQTLHTKRKEKSMRRSSARQGRLLVSSNIHDRIKDMEYDTQEVNWTMQLIRKSYTLISHTICAILMSWFMKITISFWRIFCYKFKTFKGLVFITFMFDYTR